MRVHIVAPQLLLWSAVSVSANESMAMPVSPVPSFVPTNLTVRAHLEPDAVNRAFEVSVGSSEYYQTGRIQLDGTEAPRTISLEVRNLPCGGRDVRRSLNNSDGRARSAASKRVSVLGFAGTQ